MSRGLLIALGIAAFGALLVFMTLREGAGASCEVCMAWDGRVHCASVAASSVADAEARAQAAACGVLTEGMADELACQRAPWHSRSCGDG